MSDAKTPSDTGPHRETDLVVSVREARERLGWSQAELAQRAGLSRAGISAIETSRVAPATTAALSIASALGCRLEELFALKPSFTGPNWEWAWTSLRDDQPIRSWTAELGERLLRYPVERTASGHVAHDDFSTLTQDPSAATQELARRTLVLAGCDPAAGLLVSEAARQRGIRVLALHRSSRAAIELLQEGVVHLAGVHLGRSGEANRLEASERLGTGARLLRLMSWRQGVAVRSEGGTHDLETLINRPAVRWVRRERGSGSRAQHDDLVGRGASTVLRTTTHQGVAEAIRNGSADAGICLELTSVEAGLDFVPVGVEPYDLCIPRNLRNDWRIEALRETVRSRTFRQLIEETPGYEGSLTGELVEI